MLRKLIHLQISDEYSGATGRCLPCNIIVAQPNTDWYKANEAYVLSELCRLLSENYKQLEVGSQPTQAHNNDPPAQLFGNRVRIAFVSRPTIDGGYTLIRSSSELAESFKRSELANFILDPLWIFPLDESDPDRHKPLDI